MNYTQQQKHAIFTTARKTIVTAAAGSGKTHVLAQRYLALLENDANLNISSLVAITFTRAAAREMRERVRQYLHLRFNNALDEKEKEIWSERLSESPRARIQTIHSLGADIIRANSAVLGLDPVFRVLDEAEAAKLLDDTIKGEFAGNEDQARKFYELFVRFPAQEIRDALRKTKLPLPPISDAESLFRAWVAEWETTAANSIRDYLATYSNTNIAIPMNDKLAERWVNALTLLEKVVTAESNRCKFQVLSCIAATKLNNVGKAENWGGTAAKATALKELKRLVQDARDICGAIGLPPGEYDRQAAYDLQLWKALISRVQKRYFSAKVEHNALDYEDLELLCSQLLGNRAVRDRYLSEFSHVLVDEFQDINQCQWEIINALTEEERGISLFLVGDPRQSIYAFRGADVRVINHVLQRLDEDFEKQTLSVSFRTNANLLHALNDFFGQLFTPEQGLASTDYEVNFRETLQTIRHASPNDEPTVELLCINQSGLKDVWKQFDRSAARRWEAHLLAHRLHELVDSQTAIHDKETDSYRPVGYGDIAILYRSLSDITLYEEAFSACGLPFKTYAGRGFFERQEIWDVLNCLKTLNNQLDELALASVLRSPIGNLSDDALFALRVERDETTGERKPLIEEIARAATGDIPLFPAEELVSIQNFIQLYYELRKLNGRIRVTELIIEILERSNYLAIVSANADGVRARSNLMRLVDIARSRGDRQIGDFLAYVRNVRTREVHVGQAEFGSINTVSLMTVHASKGLEFPVVVLADLGRGQPSGASLLFQYDDKLGPACRVLDEQGQEVDSYAYRRARELAKRKSAAEEKRLLYVAATRARDRLLFSGIVSESKDGSWKKENSSWKAILKWLGVQTIHSVQTDRPVIRHYHWGSARCYIAQTPPHEESLRPIRDLILRPSPVSIETLDTDDRFSVTLLGKIRPSEPTRMRHVSASQLVSWPRAYDTWDAIEGRINDEDDETVDIDSETFIPQSKELGSLVHAALRKHPLPLAGNPMQEYLAQLCWRMRFGNQQSAHSLIANAMSILETYRRSELYSELCNIEPSLIQREQPFIYRLGKIVVHGRIDLLYPKQDGSWCVVDYKTIAVGSVQASTSMLQKHAKNYAAQLSAYYHAIASSKNIDGLRAAIHYLRYGQTITIPKEKLIHAIKRLEALVST